MQAHGGVMDSPWSKSARPHRVSATTLLAGFEWTDDLINEVASGLSNDPLASYANVGGQSCTTAKGKTAKEIKRSIDEQHPGKPTFTGPKRRRSVTLR